LAFPDLKVTDEKQVASDDRIAQVGLIKGTNTGTMMGRPATGKAAAVPYMDMYRINGGKIVEAWHVEDIAGMLQQLGLVGG
jgi:predicted ester cyclase